MDYFKYQVLRIDFIDESVDLKATKDADDYIGSARIPLKDVFDQEMKTYTNLPIKNAKMMQTGMVEVQVSFLNYV